MATAEDGGPPSSNAAASYGGGGVGGKFRRKPFRRQPTPYDRPPTALRGTNNGGGSTSSWMTKLFVEPASKIISYGANHFFSSVFRKRLPPPPPQPPEVNNEVNEEVQGAVYNVQETSQEPAGGESSVPTNPRSNGICELEQLLKQKTFSRSEITHLTKLLQSKALEVPAGDDGQKNEVTPFVVKRHEQFTSSHLEETKKEGITSYADMSTPVLNSKVLEDDIATPAELAKAYMGGRPSKGSSSLLGVRHQGGTEDVGLHNNRSFTSKMPLTLLTKKTSVGMTAPENGFITPRSRGRSAIYNMARTPYSRAHPTSIFKGSRSNFGGNTGPLISSSTFSPVANEERLPMTLKRRSSALDDEVGFIGSIRRTRQKSNLLASRNPEITHGTSIGSHTKQKVPLIGEPSPKVLQAVGETKSVPITSHARVPSKSSEVAAKIFQHLEKLTPKEKSSESKLVAAWEKSPKKSTSGILSGQAVRSMEDLDASKMLMGEPHDNKLGDNSVTTLSNIHDGSSQKMRNIEQNGHKESVTPSHIWNPAIKNDSEGSLKALDATKTTDFVVENGALQSLPKKRAFRMGSQEDSCDRDNEVHSNGLAPPVDSKPASAEVPKLVKTTTPASEAAVVSQSVFFPFLAAATEKPAESTSSPVFSFSSKVTDNFPALSPESNKKTESGVESSSSLSIVSASTGSHLKIQELDKSGDASRPKAGDTNNEPDTVPQAKWPHVSSFSPASTTGISDHKNQTSTGSALIFASTTSISELAPTVNSSTSATSSGSIFGLFSKSSNIAGPAYKFGDSKSSTSLVPTTSVSKISELPEKKTEVDMNPSPGSSSSNSSVAAPPPANPGSTTFGLGSSFSHSTINLQGSPFGSASKSMGSSAGKVSQGASFPPVPSTPSPGTVSQGTLLPVSSAPSPLFGMNGNNGGSVFPSLQVPTTSNAFSFSSSVPLSGTSTVAPTSGPTSSQLNFGFSPVSEGNLLSSSGASTSSILSSGFGSSSSTTGAAESNSSASLPKFNFGGNSSVPVSSSTTGTSGIFNFGGSSSTLSAVNTGSSNTASANVFGSSWQSSTSLSPGFVFGASSTPSAATNTMPMSFNSSAGVTSNSFLLNTANASVSSSSSIPGNQIIFGTPPTGAFGLSPGNNEQMNAEDSMAEDPVQSSAPSTPLFVQPSVSPFGSTVPSQPNPALGSTVPSQPNPGFGSTVPSQPNPFMFASPQNQAAPQNPPSFQATGSLEFNAGGSFSLGSGGGDKSGRRIVKPNRNKNRKR